MIRVFKTVIYDFNTSFGPTLVFIKRSVSNWNNFWRPIECQQLKYC